MPGRILARLALLVGAFAPLTAGAIGPFPTLWVWPDVSPPCDTTLQACVGNAAPGDTVEIATNGPIAELTISFTKSVALRAAPGFEPKLSGTGIFFSSPSALATAAQSVDIEGLLDLAYISVDQFAQGPMTLRVVGDTFKPSPSSYAISLSCDSGAGPCTIEVSNNTVDLPSGAAGIVLGQSSTAAWSGRVADNVITMEEGATNAIWVAGGPLSVDVVRNRIAGTSFNGGIIIDQSLGAMTARLLDNLVVGQAGSVAPFGGVGLVSSSGLLTATVANNTLVAGKYGISASSSASGSVGGLIANNIMSGNSAFGLYIDPSVAATLANRNNLVFANYADAFTAGPGTVSADPLFVDAPHGDYHLKPASPAIDAGDDASVPADLLTDLDGNPRIRRSHVDIGAYEAPEPDAAALAVSALVVIALLGVGTPSSRSQEPPQGDAADARQHRIREFVPGSER